MQFYPNLRFAALRLFKAQKTVWHSRILQTILLISVFSLPARPVLAEYPMVAPFFVRHQGPLTQIFGLPAAESAALLASGDLNLLLALDISNSFSGGNQPDEHISLVGETSRSTLAIRYGFAPNWNLGIDLAYIVHDQGNFNDLIDFFHDTTGLSSEARTGTDDVLNYRYTKKGRELIALTENSSGIGDLLVSVGYQILADNSPAPRHLAVQMALKLPTGDSDQLLGSGSTDLAFSVLGSDSQVLDRWDVSLFGRIGGMYLTQGDIIPAQQRNWVGFGTAGLAWMPFPWMSFKLQVDSHSPFFKASDFRELTSWSTQLTGGFGFNLPAALFLDIAIMENIIVETSPDVVFHVALQKRF